MTARETVIHGHSSNTLSGLVLSISKFLDVLKTMLTFAKTFELDYGLPFNEVKTEDSEADLKDSIFLPEASLAIVKMGHFCC